MANYKQQIISKTGSLNLLGNKQRTVMFPQISIAGDSYDALQDPSAVDIQASSDAFLGYISTVANVKAANCHLGYADDATGGTNFKTLLFKGTFMPADGVWATHDKLLIKIPKDKYLVIWNSHASTAATISSIGWIHEQ